MSDISLLPEGLRGSEQSVQKHRESSASNAPEGLKMHVPSSTADEDIEIIEVDESDLGAILADEPLFTRLSYQLSAAIDSVKQKLFSEKDAAPPPKLPPQFFSPPKSGLVTKAPSTGAGGQGAAGAQGLAGSTAHPRARITPSAEMPRRVRVIRRIRKPVRITLLSSEELQAYRVDLPRRKWTLGVCCALFSIIIGGGYLLLSARVTDAKTKLDGLNTELASVKNEITVNETEWDRYRDLQTRLIALDGLLNKHVITSRVFDFLERWTIPNVAYQNATWDPDGMLSLSVTAASYADAAKQLVAFQRSSIVEEVTALSFSGSSDAVGSSAASAGVPTSPAGGTASSNTEKASSVSFELLLKLDPSAFRGPAIAAGLNPQAVPTSTSVATSPATSTEPIRAAPR